MKHDRSPKKPEPERSTVTGSDLKEALRQSEASYRALFNTIRQAIYIQDPEGRFIEVNDGACAMSGYAREEFIGRTLEFLAAPGLNDFSLVTQKIRQAFAGVPQNFEFWARRRNGEIFPEDVSLYKGAYFGNDVLIAVATDITEKKRAEKALHESEEYYRAIVNTSPDNITITDLHGTILMGSAASVVMFGLSDPAAANGRKIIEFIVPEERERLREALASIVKKEVALGDYHGVRTDGSVFPFEAHMSLMRDRNGNPWRLVTVLRDISRRKRAEEALHASESFNRGLVENMPDYIAVYGQDGKLLYVNPASARGLEYDADTLVGTHVLTYVAQEFRDIVAAKMAARHNGGDTSPYEIDMVSRTGLRRSVLVKATPIHYRNNPAILLLLIDITERRKVEKALKKSEEKFRLIVENSHDIIYTLTPEGVFIFVSPSWTMLLGHPVIQVMGQPFQKFVHPDDISACMASMQKVIRLGQRQTGVEYRVRHTDGTWRWHTSNAVPIKDEAGMIIGSEGIASDITEHKRAEKALRESEERYRTLIDQLPDYVLVHRDGILLYVNPAAASRMGYDAEKVIGKSALLFIAPECHDTVRKAITGRMTNEGFPPYEVKIVAGDGTYHMVLVNGSAINYDGKPASLNVLTDITTIKQAEKTIRSAKEDLEKRVTERTEALILANEQLITEIAARTRAEQETARSLKEKDLLLREIHHRVKNNLQIIASLLKLQSRTITDPKVLESIQDSQSRVRAMALVHERIYRSHNIAEINLKDYLNYLTKQILQFYNIQQYQIRITVTMIDIMANIDTIIPVGLILNELVTNSLKHAFPDGRKGTITIECTPQDADMLRFRYHDNGTGMPAGFDWKNSESLGLRLVNSLVDQLNGTIDAGEGEGTTFIITVQQKRDPASS